MSTQADGNTITALSEAQIIALGGLGDVLTWLAWLRKYKEFVRPLMAAFEDFVRATDWRSRLAAVGHLIDAVGAMLAETPTEVNPAIAQGLADDEVSAVAGVFEAYGEEFAAMGINWADLVTKLPQLIAFLQMAGEMVRRFRAPAKSMAAAVVVPPIHGLVYRPFGTAA